MAQLVERTADNREIVGSNPTRRTRYSGSLAVKPAPYKRETVGSNPTRSTEGKDMSDQDSERTKVVYMVVEFLTFTALLIFVYFAFCK